MAQMMILILSAAALGVAAFAALQLLVRTSSVHALSSKALAAFLILSACSSLEMILDFSGVYQRHPQFTGALWPARLFYGPVLLVYVLSMTERVPEQGLPSRLALIFAPALVAFLISLGFFALPLEWRAGIYQDGGEGGAAARLLPVIFSAGFLVLTLCYLGAAYRVLVQHVRTVRELFSNLENRTLNWLRSLLVILVLSWLWGASKIVMPGGWTSRNWVDFSDVLIEFVWIFCVGLFGLWQKPIFSEVSGRPQMISETGKYARSALSEDRQVAISARLERLMRDERAYRDPLLSLSALASQLGVTPNHLSQTLNHHIGESFFDFINRHRVEDAIAQISSTSESLLNIAYDVGFNSRSTFNLAVKKHTGQSPSAFR